MAEDNVTPNVATIPAVEVPKTYTQEEFDRSLTSEVDRRVESGIQKGLNTQREKWEADIQAKANLTAEELAKKEYDEKINGLTQKEAEINKRANKLDALDKLSEAGIPKSQRDKAIKLIVSEDTEATQSKVQAFIDLFNETKNEVEMQVKSQNSKIPAPNVGGGASPLTKETFAKLGYAGQLKLKQEHPDEYKKLLQ